MRALLTILLLLTATHVAANEQQTRSQLEQLKTEIGELQRALSSASKQQNLAQKALRQAELAIGQTAREIRTTQQTIERNRQQLTELESRRSELNRDKAAQQKEVEALIKEAYLVGQQSQLKLLLSQQDPATVSRAMAYYHRFGDARQQRISEYLNWLHELDQLSAEIESQQQQLAQQLDALEQQQQQQQKNRAQRESSLTELRRLMENDKQRLATMHQQQNELEALLKSMGEALADLKLPAHFRPFRELKGKLPMPIKGRLHNHFGQRRPNSDLHWQGLQLSARRGTEVAAIHYGRVVFADWFKGMGLLLILDHGDGYMSLYAHNESLLREPGEWVQAGEAISTVGNSGGQERSALYFEIRRNGQPTDPLNWCRRS